MISFDMINGKRTGYFCKCLHLDQINCSVQNLLKVTQFDIQRFDNKNKDDDNSSNAKM